MKDSFVLGALRRATDGLLLMSESDYPLKPFVWPAADVRPNAPKPSDSKAVPCTPAELLAYKKLPANSPVETQTPDSFLRGMCEDQPGDPPELLEMRTKFRALRDSLPSMLENTVVYRVGRVKITAFVIGTIPETGDLAGFETTQVET